MRVPQIQLICVYLAGKKLHVVQKSIWVVFYTFDAQNPEVCERFLKMQLCMT